MHNGDVKSFVKFKRGTALKVTEFPEVCIVRFISKMNSQNL